MRGRGSGWGAEPHVNTSACPTGLHGQQATQTNRATDRQTGGQTDRQTDEERPKPFSGQTNDLEKPNESKRTKEMRDRKILENMKGKKGAAKRRSGERAVSWGEKYGRTKCTTTWQTETIAMTEQMFSSCPRGGKPGNL